MIRLVALVALALVTSSLEAPVASLASHEAGQALDVDAESSPSVPASAARVLLAPAPSPVRQPASTEAPRDPLGLTPHRPIEARPRWRRVPRLRSDATGDD